MGAILPAPATSVDLTAPGPIGGTTPGAGTFTTVTAAAIAGAAFGTGVPSALTIAIGSAGAPVLFNGAGGTPSSLTLTNATGLPAAGVTGTAVTQTTLSNASLPASFTTLAASGVTTLTANTASTTTGTGTLVVTGGVGVSGKISSASAYVTSGASGVTANSNYNQVVYEANGNVGISFLCATGSTSGAIAYGRPGNNLIAANGYYHGSDYFWWARGSDVMYLDATKLSLLQGTASSSTTTGSLVVTGGAGISGQVSAGSVTGATFNGNTFTTGTYTLTGTAGKTLTFSNTLTLAGTDSTTLTFPSTSATIARTDAAQTFTGIHTFTGEIDLTSAATVGLQIFNTADQTTNFESVKAYWSSNIFRVESQRGGSASAREMRFASSTGLTLLLANTAGSTTGAISLVGASSATASTIAYAMRGSTNTATSGTNIGLSLTPTWNQSSGTAANTDMLINRTQTAVGSGAQLLIDAQVAGASKFSVDNTGVVNHGAVPKFSGTNTTGAGVTVIGSNCPAVTPTAPYTWIQVTTADGSTGYIPVWK